MALKGDTFTFSVSERGETSGEKYNWSFEAKKRLTIRDRIQKDSTRRSIIGERPQDALPETVIRAEMLAHLAVSIVDSPKAWKETNGGLDVADDNILMAIYEKINEGQNAAQAEVDKGADEAKEKLRKAARSKKAADDEEEPESQKDEGSHGGA